MKRTIATAVFAFLFFLTGVDLYSSDCLAKAGGVSVVIPTPGKLFAEVGSKRDSFEYMVPSRNRLLCAFVSTDSLPHLTSPATGLDRYMVVEVSRSIDEKNVDITTVDFEQVVASTKQHAGDFQSNSAVQASLEEVINRLKAIENTKDISMGKPIPLGTSFQTTDAYGSLMILPVSPRGTTVRILGASILIRVRSRLIFAYVYAPDDESSLKWIQATAQEWSHQILAANSGK